MGKNSRSLKSLGNKNVFLITLFYVVNIALTAYLFYFLYTLASPEEGIKDPETGALIGPTFLAVGILVYLLGVRHAVDADHLAAIDNATRKLLQEGKNPNFIGFFFSLGHSTVVILMTIMVIVVEEYVSESLANIEEIGGIIGTLVSGSFLYIIGFSNLLIALEIYNMYRIVKKEGVIDEQKLNEILQKRGFISRLYGKLFKIITRQWHMYIIGLLFGFGFETATQIALYTIAGGVAAASADIPTTTTILVFPILFMLGMTLVDTSDGIFMRAAYGWAFKDTLRKLWYNLTMTLISIVIAFGIGTIQLLALISEKFGLSGFFWGQINVLTTDEYWQLIGFYIIGTFAITWLISWIIYKRWFHLSIITH